MLGKFRVQGMDFRFKGRWDAQPKAFSVLRFRAYRVCCSAEGPSCTISFSFRLGNWSFLNLRKKKRSRTMRILTGYEITQICACAG